MKMLAAANLETLKEANRQKEGKASCCLIYLLQTSLFPLSTIRKCNRSTNHAKACQLTLACMCSPLPRWTGSASHMDSVCISSVLKGSFHNGPWWGWDDGYGLSLGVNAAGLGPPQVYSVTSFAICQHWVGTNPWPGLGQHTHQDHLQQHTPHFRDKVGRSVRHTSAAQESLSVYISCNSTGFCSYQMTVIVRYVAIELSALPFLCLLLE